MRVPQTSVTLWRVLEENYTIHNVNEIPNGFQRFTFNLPHSLANAPTTKPHRTPRRAEITWRLQVYWAFPYQHCDNIAFILWPAKCYVESRPSGGGQLTNRIVEAVSDLVPYDEANAAVIHVVGPVEVVEDALQDSGREHWKQNGQLEYRRLTGESRCVLKRYHQKWANEQCDGIDGIHICGGNIHTTSQFNLFWQS